jgi:hypothetical protein
VGAGAGVATGAAATSVGFFVAQAAIEAATQVINAS